MTDLSAVAVGVLLPFELAVEVEADMVKVMAKCQLKD
jgi:hypothetical protein